MGQPENNIKFWSTRVLVKKTDMYLLMGMNIGEPALSVIFETYAYYSMVKSDFKPGKWFTVTEHRYPIKKPWRISFHHNKKPNIWIGNTNR